MKKFIENILIDEYGDGYQTVYDNSPLIQYLNLKTGAIYGNSKTRRSLANIYAIYSILHFYQDDYFGKKEEYENFKGYDYTKLSTFYTGLYGGSKLQNHALNSRVNGEFINRIVGDGANYLIVIDNGKYAVHIEYLYVDGNDISKVVVKIIEEYIELLKVKDNALIATIGELSLLTDDLEKKNKIYSLINEESEARIFEIISYAILKNHYLQTKVYFGTDKNNLTEQSLKLYKTGRTNANDGGIDFVMRPLGRFYQVTEVNSYDKYLLDIDKVMRFPITFVIKTAKPKEQILKELKEYIEVKSGGMKIIKDRYIKAIEEIITINELKEWLYALDSAAIIALLRDIDLYYRLELNLLIDIEEDASK